MQNKWHKRLLITAIFCLSVNAHSSDSQVHLLAGPIVGAYDGQFSGEFEVPVGFDFNYEFFYRARNSIYFRFTMGLDSPESRPFYTYAGIGHRFYLFSHGRYTTAEDDGLSFNVSPTWRFYVAPDIGIAQIIVKSFGTVVQSISSVWEAGVSLGAMYKVSQKLSAEAQIGGTQGYGFSSVPVTGNTYRLLVGASYFF